ncbi:MAG TPA: hypothetical protein PKL81_13230 [Ferruginibacter sp.]|jgi:hypothetical protein|nr:hypothetical protein [Ferruginibacter sp.]HNO98669.1 hypothetical protein [Ferruginibacter sp.]
MKPDHLTVTENSNLTTQTVITWTLLVHNLVYLATYNPDKFSSITRIKRQLPGDKAVVLTISQIAWCIKSMDNQDIPEEIIRYILENPFGVIAKRELPDGLIGYRAQCRGEMLGSEF